MNKNIVFMINVNLDNQRNLPYQYSIKSGKYGCEYNNCELFILDKPITDINYMKLTGQRYYLFDILKANDIDYSNNKILMVDADTIIHPKCPNFFNLIKDDEYGAILNDGCYEGVIRSIKGGKKYIFKDDNYVLPGEYINGGFQIVNKNHEEFFNKVTEFYKNNYIEIKQATDKIKAGTDQTCINFLLNRYNIKKKYLPNIFNLQDMFRKNLLYTNGYSGWDDKFLYTKAGGIYHFNAIPNNHNADKTLKYMKECYEHLYRGL